MDPWLHPEAGRFHRGISLSVVAIAALVPLAEATRNHAPVEAAIIGAAFAAAATVAWHMHAAVRATPANVPTPAMPAGSPGVGYSKQKEAKR